MQTLVVLPFSFTLVYSWKLVPFTVMIRQSDTFAPGWYFRINEFSGLLNRLLIQKQKSVTTLFIRISEISGLSEPGLTNHHCILYIFLHSQNDISSWSNVHPGLHWIHGHISVFFHSQNSGLFPLCVWTYTLINNISLNPFRLCDTGTIVFLLK